MVIRKAAGAYPLFFSGWMPADEQSGCFSRSENTEIGKYRFFLRYERRDAAGAAELLSVILSSEESVSMMKGGLCQ